MDSIQGGLKHFVSQSQQISELRLIQTIPFFSRVKSEWARRGDNKNVIIPKYL